MNSKSSVSISVGVGELQGPQPSVLSIDTNLLNKNSNDDFGHIGQKGDSNGAGEGALENGVSDEGKGISRGVSVNGRQFEKQRIPYVNLFKNNRMAKANYKLEFVDTGDEKLKFGFEHIDPVEKAFGFCLLGFVVGGRPPMAALIDLVKRWGSNIHFQTHENGWITFTFPSAEVRDRILSGGLYMVFGFHLVLKEMPPCFRFREEDLNTLPLWVQIHGIPPDCWNFYILSRVASKIGKPIHMDMLTHDRKRTKYARVLIELKVDQPRRENLQIKLSPLGDVDVDVKFIYEQDIKVCDLCNKVGHDSALCILNTRSDPDDDKQSEELLKKRSRSKSVVWRRNKPRGRSRMGKVNRHAPSRPNSITPPLINAEGSTVPVDVEPCKQVPGHGETHDPAVESPIKVDKGKKVIANELPILGNPSNEGVDDEGFKTVSSKKNKKKKKKSSKGNGDNKVLDEQRRKFFEALEESSSCSTEYVHVHEALKDVRFFGNPEKGRQPKIASSSL